MIRKPVVAILAALAVSCFAMPAAAETFTSQDGVVSIELPGENWKQIEDVTKWITLSDGANQITIEHYSNGEKLPEFSAADTNYVNIIQASFSTQNEVFIATGSVVDAEKVPEITNAIMSIKVLKYDTKHAITGTSEAGTSEFTVILVDKTMYVTADYLNVRRECSADSQLLGGYKKGSEVRVTGSVRKNGADLGWYQVNYEGGTGYVSGEFLSDEVPASTENNSDDDSSVYTGNVVSVFDEYGTAYTLYQTKDGLWRDNDGTAYSRKSETDFQAWEGNKILSIYNYGPDNYDYSDQEGEGNLQYCWDCDQWYESGYEFDNHDCPGKNNSSSGSSGSSDNYDYSDQEGEGNLQYCWKCGQWFEAGYEFDNHYCPG